MSERKPHLPEGYEAVSSEVTLGAGPPFRITVGRPKRPKGEPMPDPIPTVHASTPERVEPEVPPCEGWQVYRLEAYSFSQMGHYWTPFGRPLSEDVARAHAGREALSCPVCLVHISEEPRGRDDE